MIISVTKSNGQVWVSDIGILIKETQDGGLFIEQKPVDHCAPYVKFVKGDWKSYYVTGGEEK